MNSASNLFFQFHPCISSSGGGPIRSLPSSRFPSFLPRLPSSSSGGAPIWSSFLFQRRLPSFLFIGNMATLGCWLLRYEEQSDRNSSSSGGVPASFLPVFLSLPAGEAVFFSRAVDGLCTMKLGRNLYQRIEKECDEHISTAIQSLLGRSTDLAVFMSLVENCSQDLCDEMKLIRSIDLVIDRKYVKHTPNMRSLWDMGLHL